MNYSFLILTVYGLHLICSIFKISSVTFDSDNVYSSVYELPPNSFNSFYHYL